MKTLKKLGRTMTVWRSAFARHAVEIVSNPALANHTPAGPGSLATGQSAMAGRGGPHIRSESCGDDSRAADTRPAYAEYSMPLRQVFWI